jgi:HD-like signal output (HDOD) protein
MTPTAADLKTKPWSLGLLPPLPAIALKVLEELSHEDFATGKVVRWIEADPAFTAELLRVANSAMYGSCYQIRSVHRAATTLGADFVKALAITVAMRIYLKTALRLPILRRCWRHSLACGILAEELSLATFDDVGAGYTAGMLHDVGRMGFLATYPAEYAALLGAPVERSVDLLHRERALFEVDHCEAGEWLARKWKLPLELETIAARHHDEPDQVASTLNRIRLACRLADALGFSVIQGESCDEYLGLMARLSSEARARFPDNFEYLKATIVRRIDALS